MDRKNIRCSVFILALLILFVSCKTGNPPKQVRNGLVLEMEGQSLHVRFLSDRIVRVVHSPMPDMSSRESLVVTGQGADVELRSRDEGDYVVLESEKLIVRVDKRNGTCTFGDKDGRTYLSEGVHSFREDTVMHDPCYNVSQQFILSEGEALYGLGQHQDGIMNWRGHDVTLVQTNVHAVTPFVLSTSNYGLLWDNYSKTLFSDDETGMELWSEVADQVDYYFIAGDDMDQVIAGYRELTGPAPMFGKWAFGYWQSKERYTDATDLLAIAAEYRARGIPIDNIVQDWRYWALYDPDDYEGSRQSAKDHWSSMEFHPSTYPDPAAVIREVHEKYNMHYMISIWPTVGRESRIFDEMNAAGHLLPPETWSAAYLYDAYSQEARETYWKYVRRGLMDQGVDALWMDGTEPELGDQHYFDDSEQLIKKFGKNALGSMARYLNTYSLVTTGGVYENWRHDIPGKRVFILTRSGFAGQQRHAAVTWSGDINATWPVLRNQIAAGLNFSMAGIPYWTMDIGAFFLYGHDRGYGEGNYQSSEEPAYRELYTRWFQFGAFCPIFRSHGTHTPREVWRFGEPGTPFYESLLKFDNLRYRLLPYIYSLAWKVTSEGYTLMRGLAMDFPGDRNVREINDQYMFGPALLVAPVTEEQHHPESGITTLEVKGRETWLPDGTSWFDFWTGEEYEGGQHVWQPTPIDVMPLFVRSGSILPMGPFKQYSTEVPEDPLEVRIYPGADGSFTLYEDENDSYRYEEGFYSLISFNWDDKSKSLTIGDRMGAFHGMLPVRTIRVVLVRNGHGAGEKITGNADQVIEYSGNIQTLLFD